MKVAVVAPTVREECIKKFLAMWDFNCGYEYNVYIIEDNPTKTFNLGGQVKHFSWQEIDQDLKEKSWIIPRRTDCVRSYGFFKAWRDGADIIITLDDDCYPTGDQSLIMEHAKNLNQEVSNDWVSTLDFNKPRGLPFKLPKKPVMISHGLWRGVLDLDAPTQLAGNVKEELYTEKIIPKGTYFPMCGMNLAFRREVTPLMYFLLMGKDYQYDRFGDIWCGVIAKKICDHLGFAIHSGYPLVEHQRASNVWANLKKEAPGLEVNEWLWQEIDKIELTSPSVWGSYAQIARKLGLKGEYWDKLKQAMEIWVGLFLEEKNEKDSVDKLTE